MTEVIILKDFQHLKAGQRISAADERAQYFIRIGIAALPTEKNKMAGITDKRKTKKNETELPNKTK